MRRLFVLVPLVALVSAVSGCDNTVTGPPQVGAPTSLIYELEPSGDPVLPAGLLLRWDGVPQASLQVYRVYSRPNANSVFALRGATTSTTFHDRGQPDLEYYVVAVDLNGLEGAPSNTVSVDERLRLESPDWLETVTLNGAIYVAWADNPYETAPDGFKWYRVYSSPYDLDANECGAWSLEGTTIAPEFLAGVLPNGVPWCFGVSAISIEGWESLWSDIWADTPRPDARNVVVWADEADATRSGFRFFLDGNGDGTAQTSELGLVRDGGLAGNDFRVTRDVNGDFFLDPVRTGTSVALYGSAPIADLTSIDVAPTAGYGTTAIQALPMWGYVFEMDGGDGFARFGALRVTHVGQDWMIFDWSYQTDPGNPELSVGAGLHVADGGIVVKR